MVAEAGADWLVVLGEHAPEMIREPWTRVFHQKERSA